jgi:hypothetical protein
MADKDSQKEEIAASVPNLTPASPQDNIIQATSSQWLVEDLTPATMIMVDDSPPGTFLD